MAPNERRTSDLGAEPTTPQVPLVRRFNSVSSLAIGLLVTVALVSAAATLQSNAAIGELTLQVQRASEQPTRVLRVAALAESVAFQGGTADGAELERWQSELAVESELLTRTLDGLLAGDADLGIPRRELSAQLEAVYFSDPERAAADLRSYAETGTRIAGLNQTALNEETAPAELLPIIRAQPDLVADTQKAVRIYHDQIAVAVARQRTATLILLAVTLLGTVVSVVLLFRPLGRSIDLETSRLERAERKQRESNEFQTYRNNLAEALDTTTNKDEVLAAVGRAFMDVVPEQRAELLLVDESQGHLRRAQVSPELGAAACPVDAPDQCAALRRGQTMHYDSSRALNVCPKLPEHETAPCSAVCVPVTFNGHASGVIHLVGAELALPRDGQVDRLQVLASETGSRLGLLETTEQRNRQASTDGLTGLINRRELEDQARELLIDQRPFAIAMADLDRFKELNDRHGHDSGDRALRLFALVLQAELRPTDIASRYGGEEFVILLPDTDVAEAHKTIERLRRSIAEQIRNTGFLPFTASWGVTDSESATTFRDIVGVADSLMYTAKREGRNLMVIDAEAAARAGVDPDEDAIVDGAGTLLPSPQIDLDLERLAADLTRHPDRP